MDSITSQPELPMAGDRLIGASCSLSAAEMRERLADWRGLRERASTVEPITGGLRLTFSATEPVAPIADLASRESECCGFYTFTLRLDGAMRELQISSGPGNDAAVSALLGIEQ